MNERYIRLSEVIQQMDKLDSSGRPERFNIKFVTADRKRGTSGEIIEVKNARKCVDVRDGEPVFDTRSPSSNAATSISRPPNHWLHGTRNILLENGRIRKVHIRLIIEFNGKKVCF